MDGPDGPAAGAASIAEAEAVALLMDEARGLGDAADFFRDTNENRACIQTKPRLHMNDGSAVAIMANGSGFDRDERAGAAANVIFTMRGAGQTPRVNCGGNDGSTGT